MGTTSLRGQVIQLANEHTSFGVSKKEIRVENLKNGMKRNEATRDHFFSSSTKQDFIRTCTQLVKKIKSEHSEVKLLGQITSQYFREYWSNNAGSWSKPTQATYLDHFSRLNRFIQQKGWGNGFLSESVRFFRPTGYKSVKNSSDRATAHTDQSIERLIKSLPQEYHRRIDGKWVSTGITYRDMVVILKETGIRAIEFQRIKWSDVKSDRIDVVGKGGRPRTIPLTREAKEAFDNIKMATNPKGLDEKVFGVVKTKSIRTAIRRVNKRYQDKNRSIHSLRHYYAHKNYFEKYLQNRQNGMSKREARRDARGWVSHLLGHGRVTDDRGRISVTYAYVSGQDGASLESRAELIIANEGKLIS